MRRTLTTLAASYGNRHFHWRTDMARIRRTFMAIAVAALVMSAAVAPAAASETKHGSCRDFGAAFAAWAHSGAGSVGGGMSALARSAPGAAAAAIEYEKLVDLGGGVPACDVR